MNQEKQDSLSELKKIDTSAVEQLARLKSDRDVLLERLERLKEEQGNVSEAVFERIRQDYEGRTSDLEERAVPLATQAREEYAKLAALLKSVEQAAASSALDKEELQLRLKLAEFDEDEFQRLTLEVDKALKRHQKELTGITKVKELFVSAFESEDDLRSSMPPLPSKPQIDHPADELEPAAKKTPAIEPAVAGTVVDTEALPPPEAPAPAAKTPEPEQPSAPGPAPEAAKPKESKPAESAETPGGGPAKTAMLLIARLKPLDATADQPEIILGPTTTLGRTPENDIQISEPAVSRGHALIEISDAGFLLRDLNSGNGTYVNGEAIKEHLLVTGDRVQIGTTRFEFSS